MKRIIFTLLYEDGYFIQSRNFRKQKVGNINWLFQNYQFDKISYGLDEVQIIDVSEKKNFKNFCKVINQISKKLFLPVAAGGGIKSVSNVSELLNNGADKIILNKLYLEDPNECIKISKTFGKQSIIACIDYRSNNKKLEVCFRNLEYRKADLKKWILDVIKKGCGEIILQSIDKDGTGMGPDEKILKFLNKNQYIPPIIIMGGVGKTKHIKKILNIKNIDAVSTANLFNFIGNAFIETRDSIIKNKINVIRWNTLDMKLYRNIFK